MNLFSYIIGILSASLRNYSKIVEYQLLLWGRQPLMGKLSISPQIRP